MKLLAKQMAVVEMAKVWKKGDNFIERLDIMIKGNEIRNNTVTRCSPLRMKGTMVFSILLVLEM